jgi:hypothetical protein
MKQLFILLLSLGLKFSYAQLVAGAAYGTFNNPGSAIKFRGWGPTLMLEYTNDEESEVYLNFSLYKKSINTLSEAIYENDAVIGNKTITETYNYKYLQLGFKRALVGDFSDTRFNWFAGGGGALGFVNSKDKYETSGNEVSSVKYNYLIYGFNFSTGMQWRIQPVIIELKGNLDFSLKPIVSSNGGGYMGAYVLTSTRLGILVPITKY